MTGADVTVEVEAGIATIVLRPRDGSTTLDSATRAQLQVALVSASDDAAVDVIVIHGEGRDFCEGRDLSEVSERIRLDIVNAGRELEAQTAQLVSVMAAVPKPIIGAVHGRCIGEGLALALACDLRVIADDAELRAANAPMGAVGSAHLRDSLSRWAGADRAREIFLSNRAFAAREVVDWGCPAEIVPSENVIEIAQGQAGMLAKLASSALPAAKVRLAGAAALELERALRAGEASSGPAPKLVASER